MTAVFKSQWPLEIQIQILDRMCLARVSHYLFMDHFSEMHSLHSTLTSAHNLNNLSHSLSLPTDHSIKTGRSLRRTTSGVLFDPATSGNSRPVFRNSHFSLTNRTKESAKWMRLRQDKTLISRVTIKISIYFPQSRLSWYPVRSLILYLLRLS